MKKLILCLILAVSSLFNCKKDEANVTPTPTFSIVGNWVLESAKVTIDSKEYIVLRADLTKRGYFKSTELDFAFTADGKYTKGTETGTYTLEGTKLKLGIKTYAFTSSDADTFGYGNKWEPVGYNDTMVEVFTMTQKIVDNLDVGLPAPENIKTATYSFNYKRK